MNTSKTKINLYKFVSTTGIAAASDASAEEKATLGVQTKQVEAINQLGGVVNGIAASLGKIEEIEIARAKALAKKARDFKPEYTKPKKIKANFAGKLMEAFKAPNFLKGLLQMLGALFKMLVGIPVLKWLADEKNQKTIVNTFKVIWSVFKGISKFIGSAFVIGINSLARAMKGDGMSSWQRIFFFAKGIVAFGAILIGLKWLNPLRISKTMKEIGFVFKGFNNALFNFRNALRAKKGLRALTNKGGIGGLKYGKNFARMGKYGLITTGVLATGAIVNDMVRGNDGSGEDGEDVPERKYGGEFSTGRKLSKYGGLIRGPETGYPVSMDGGKSTSFIGHGTEQVVTNRKGGGYVIPINNSATRANPYLTDFNRMAAAGMAPELFLGGVFKGLGNLGSGKTWGGGNRGTGRDGGFGMGTYGSGRPSDGAQTQAPTKNPGLWGQIGNFLTKGDGQRSGAQMIGGMFGNEQAGGAIGNILGIFQGGGSGENGKATGWDIIKGIGGVAGSFTGGKASGWINSAMGIGDILKGDGNWQSKFRDIAGAYGNKLAGLIGGKTGDTVGNFLNSYFNGTASGGIGGILGGAASAAGTGRLADLGNHAGYTGGTNVRDPEGGIGAAKILGRRMLDRGYTVFGHPNFRNNKFAKEIGANHKGFDASGRSPVGGGPLHSKGLGLDIADYRPGGAKGRLRNLAQNLRDQIDTFKITQIIHDGWGMWFAGDKEKRGPSRYGMPNRVHVGIAEKTPDDVGGATGVGSQAAIANNQRSIMKKALEGGDGSTGDAAMNIRKVLTQGAAAEGGAKKGDFGGNYFLDLLGDNSKISDSFMSKGDLAKGYNAFELAQDDNFITNFLYKKGADENQAMNYMNLIDGDAFTKTPTFTDSDFMSFSDSLKIGNSMYTKEGQGAKEYYASKNAGVTDDTIKKKANNQNQRGSAFQSKKKDSLVSRAPKGTSNVNSGASQFGSANQSSDDKSKEYYQKKAAKDRQHATSAMNDKIQATIQAALAAVQAHNAGVTATVQSENQKVMQMLKSAQSMAAKVAAKKRDRQQNQNQSAVA